MARTKTTHRGPKLTRKTHKRLLTTERECEKVMRLAHIYAIQQTHKYRDEEDEDEEDEEMVWMDWTYKPFYKRICITKRKYDIYCEIGQAWRDNKGSRYNNKRGFAAYPYKTMYFKTI